ncbi:MAG: ATP-grasp domain-containing protein [Candidatus Roizmanbacteria bacterium]|nr:ATP-grasp domain-containing protein [Candidatus Roizmanbacteria bacterium]
MNIAFLYNVRHHYNDSTDYKKQLERDFDDPVTTKWQIHHLKRLGFNVIPVEANEKAYFKLFRLRSKIDLVFNVAEGIYGKDRELQMPAILEMLQIPYTGSSPLTHAFSLNKAKAKEIFLANNIPTTDFQTINEPNFTLKKTLKFPLIVKPVAEGSSMGITNNSVVYDLAGLKKQVKKILNVFNEPALVEPFLEGREFSIAMLGNPPEILPIIESNHKILPKKYLPLDSYEVKWFFEEEGHSDYLICPAKIDKKLKNKLKKICYQVWDSLNVEDWCRIDIRCDKNENPYVLEINSPSGIAPPEVTMTSYFPLAARTAGIDYKNLLNKIIKTALKRYK